jgi:hypothetical protein
MKPRLWLSLIIFLSAYAPLALLFAIRDFNTDTKWFGHPPFVYISLVVALLSVLLLFITMSFVTGQFLVKVNRISLRSSDLVNYSIPYLISFFSVDFGKIQDVLALLLFMVLLFLLTLKTQSIFINPVLAFRAWGLYEVEFEESGKSKTGVFLSKIELKPGARYQMDRISQFLYVVANEHPSLED